jgi:tetratricopeptide (TPR) repeat protein
MRRTTLSAATAAILMAALVATGAWAAGGSSAASVPVPENPEQQAADHYNRALKYRDKAWELEKEAAGASGEEAEKLAKKITKQYEKAATALRSAIDADPKMYQAHGSLGYALRKLEKYDEALAAYDQALALNPGYSEAIEYRAEAYLGLNRLEDVMGSEPPS